MVVVCSQEPFPIFWNEAVRGSQWNPVETPEELCATIDTGCQRMAIGLNTLNKLDKSLPPGLQTQLTRQEHKFRSVHGTSTTKFAAVIPTSLGTKGSLLRPAIFDNIESRDAPFLISLPFLMYCKAVLNLDPSQGLTMELKRFGFRVNCHLGPSGALRVPLGQFTDGMKQKLQTAQRQFQAQQSEFEILRTTQVFAQASSVPPFADPSPVESPHASDVSYGCPRQRQEVSDGERCRRRATDCVAAHRDEGALRGGQDDRADGATGGNGTTQAGAAILGISSSIRGLSDRHLVGDCGGAGGAGELGWDFTCRGRDREPHPSAALHNQLPGSSISGIQHERVSGVRGDSGELCDGRGHADLRATTNVPAQHPMQGVHLPEGGAQSQPAVLAMQSAETPPVSLLRVDPLPAVLGRGEVPAATSRRTDDELSNTAGEPGYIIEEHQTGDTSYVDSELTNHSDWQRGPFPMPPSPSDPSGDQWNQLPGEVCRLWEASEEGATEFQQREQQGQHQEGEWRESTPHDQGDPGRVPRVPGVPQVETVQETGQEGGRERLREGSKPVIQESKETDSLNRRQRRTLRQARTALEAAEANWNELMSLLRTDSDKVESVGWSRFDSCAVDRRDQQKFLWLLQKTKNQMKVVAELYNPNRFQDKLDKYGLCRGQAFDLKLGHDLTKHNMRQEVRRYVREMKPGLVIISPPCTLFSLLQNLNRNFQNPEANPEFLRRLIEAKVLLRFGIEIAFEVLKYGGSFVFEHPLTSRAWMDNLMQKRIQSPEVHMAACDQCQFGLRAQSGALHRKSTGFLSNNVQILDQLRRRCDGSHFHEPVLGRDEGGLRSLQAQHYPPRLVEAILKGYKMSIGQPLTILRADLGELKRDQERVQRILTEMRSREKFHIVETEKDPINEVHHVPAENEVPEEPQEIEDEETAEELHRYLPRERPFSTAQLVRRAHEGLGHPGNDRLARILKDAKASEEAINLAKNLKCSVCERHAATRPARRAAPPKQLHVNQVVGVDTIYLPDHQGKRRMALNIVDWASRFQIMVPLAGHTPGAARRAYLQWVRLFGPPEKLYTDLGREFKGVFEIGAEQDSTFIEPSSLEMPTQRSITERAGRSFKEVLTRTMMQVACNTHEEWLNVVDIVNMTCNRLMNKSGFSPIQRVLGFSPRIPGGLMTGGGNDLATASRRGGDLQVQRAEEVRLAAAKAFHEADSCQALRNAVTGGPRPVRDFEVGQLVYFWRKGTDGPKKNNHSFWRGPGRVVLTSPPSTVWINYRGFIVKAAPEQLRLATEEERFTLTGWINDLTGTRDELDKIPRQGYLDLTKEPFPINENEDGELPEHAGEGPKYRLHGKTAKDQIVVRDSGANRDEWVLDEPQGLLHRLHRQPREEYFQPSEDWLGCPVPRERIRSFRLTVGQYEINDERFEDEDDWILKYGKDTICLPWTGRTTFKLHPPDAHPAGQDLPRLQHGPSGQEHPDEERREIAEEVRPHHVRRGREDANEDEDEEGQHKSKRLRGEERPTEDDEDEYTPSLAGDGDEDLGRGEVRHRDPGEEPGEPEPKSKRHRTEFMDLLMTSLEKVMAAKLKKEVKFGELRGEEREKFKKAMEKEVKNNLKTKAYVILSPEESEEIRRNSPEKIVKSRLVMTEKSIDEDDIEAARQDGVLLQDQGPHSTKAKARHVMKGFSEENSENLETTTPQCGRETVLSVLQMLCSMKWLPGYLDFTQAFHSGDDIKREIYAAQPHDAPLPGYSPRQLLKLLKTCYGLLDGPYAWYQHLKGVLLKLGYECSAADPCLFYLFNPERQLQGIISVATDDLLHGGTEQHWKNMRWINENYKLGKFTQGNGRFVGKEIVCQKDGTFLVHQPLYTQKLQTIKLDSLRKKQKYAYCAEEEISQLRGLLGGLAWLAKETRPDLAGRVAILQQSMPRPYIQDIVEANALAREAIKHSEVGLKIHPIPMEHLRVGTVTDASWANVRVDDHNQAEDFWEERSDRWIRHHVQPRRLLFHPASVPGGPNVYHLQERRVTFADGEEYEDVWDGKRSIRTHRDEPWCGQSVLFKKKETEPIKAVTEKFLQQDKLASQGGYISFFYDARMETEEKAYPISVVSWKSFKIKRCTVNTLSAECQAMIHGVGSIHWLRFLLQESFGGRVQLEDWEQEIGKIPCIAVTDSKSLFDTMQKCCNTSAHIEDKRTAIDVTVLKRDFQKTKGQVWWIQGTKMISDSLTKKMGSGYLRNVLKHGTWSLSEKGFTQEAKILLLISADRKSGRCGSG